MPASKERQNQIREWIEKNTKLLSNVDWNKPAPLKSSVLSYNQLLVHQALLRDRIYSETTEAFDALRSFRRYVIKHLNIEAKNACK